MGERLVWSRTVAPVFPHERVLVRKLVGRGQLRLNTLHPVACLRHEIVELDLEVVATDQSLAREMIEEVDEAWPHTESPTVCVMADRPNEWTRTRELR
jgi:hypothetical protein